MKKSLYFVVLLTTQFAFAQGNLDRDAVFYEPSQDSVTWLFKQIIRGKEKIISVKKGDRIKVFLNRSSPKDGYPMRCFLVDINESDLVLVDKKMEQQKIEKSLVKRIIVLPEKDILKNVLGGFLLLLGIVLLGLVFLFTGFPLHYSPYGVVFGLIGVLITLLGFQLIKKGTSQIINKPFSEDWEITRVDDQTKYLPSIEYP